MNSNWAFNLDMCASNGILDYDAAADLTDQPSRYMGHPKMNEIPELQYLPEGTKMKANPQIDTFENQSNNLIENPRWKKFLSGVLIATGIGAGIFSLVYGKKFKMPKVPNIFKKFPKINISKPKLGNIRQSIKNIFSTAWGYIKVPFVKLGNLIKRKP